MRDPVLMILHMHSAALVEGFLQAKCWRETNPWFIIACLHAHIERRFWLMKERLKKTTDQLCNAHRCIQKTEHHGSSELPSIQ